jgi:hypothetical protein
MAGDERTIAMVRSQFCSIMLLKFDESHGNHPIFDRRRIWVEREYLQLYRVEVVYLDRRLGVGVQIFVELLQDGMYFEGCFWRRQKRRLFLRVSEDSCKPARTRVQAHLARRQDTVHLPNDGLITAKVRRGIEYKADVKPEVVSLIITQQLDRKPEHFVYPRGAGYEPSAEGTLSDDVLGNVIKVEEGAIGREGPWCEAGFTRDSEDLSGVKRMLDARELPEGVGEAAPEMNPAAEEAIRPSGT